MKKFFKRLMVVLIAFIGVFAFVGCDDDNSGDGGGGTQPQQPAHTHSYSSTWSSNSVEHYKVCTQSGCTSKTSVAAHTYTDDICDVCGYDNRHVHTFTQGAYEYNDDYHWQECTTCDGTSAQVPHQMSGNTCSICGIVKQSQTTDDIAALRDLEITTYQSTNGGVFTLVKLPDGKNMLIDSTTSVRADKTELRRALMDGDSNMVIDYFVLTNVGEARCANAYYVLSTYEVKNVYVPNTTGVGYTISSESAFAEALEYAKTMQGTTLNVVTNSNDIDINRSFSFESKSYSYYVDFMAPVAASTAVTDAADSSVYVAIEYQGKIVLLTSDATNANIDAYANGSYNYNVDVLITGYNVGYKDAIRLSGTRGSDFLGDIGLTSSDYVLFTNLGETTGLSNVWEHIRSNGYTSNIHQSFATATVKVAKGGGITVTTA